MIKVKTKKISNINIKKKDRTLDIRGEYARNL